MVVSNWTSIVDTVITILALVRFPSSAFVALLFSSPLHDDIMSWKRFPQWQANSPIKGPVKQNFYVLSAVSLNKMLNKQLSQQWFEMSWRSFHVTVLSPPFPISFFLPRTPKTPGANYFLLKVRNFYNRRYEWILCLEFCRSRIHQSINLTNLFKWQIMSGEGFHEYCQNTNHATLFMYNFTYG